MRTQLESFEAERAARIATARACRPTLALLHGGPTPEMDADLSPMTAEEVREGMRDIARIFMRLDDNGRRAILGCSHRLDRKVNGGAG